MIGIHSTNIIQQYIEFLGFIYKDIFEHIKMSKLFIILEDPNVLNEFGPL